ncbi:hypothetical protein [Xylophilus ampelinus]|uniref:Uncharacterized protein n=1 Tax=Xylophilus ampelinus TaxID=54067 RepID=A0A318SPW9_9BURK|nr:hypothetical protein [Xylophilus ampelinus]MCS4508916.1 hypothetical protein [Xylophilus ampelinus]PYE79482.1 hypothetical protein DFQ15_102215 [Xylophilus ampelinus]
MNAGSQQLHLTRPVYEVRHEHKRGFQAQLIERTGRLSYGARIEAIFATEEAVAFIDAHRAELKSGTTLQDLDLVDIHAHNDVLRGYVAGTPRIAPPRHAAAPANPPQAEPA